MNRNRRFNGIIVILKGYSLLLVVLGLSTIFIRNNSILSPLNYMINQVYFNQMDSELTAFNDVVFGLMGLLLFMLGLMTFLMIHYSLGKKHVWSWQTLMATYGIMLVFMGYLLVVYFVNLIMIIVAATLFLFLILLIFIKNDCIKRS